MPDGGIGYNSDQYSPYRKLPLRPGKDASNITQAQQRVSATSDQSSEHQDSHQPRPGRNRVCKTDQSVNEFVPRSLRGNQSASIKHCAREYLSRQGWLVTPPTLSNFVLQLWNSGRARAQDSGYLFNRRVSNSFSEARYKPLVI